IAGDHVEGRGGPEVDHDGGHAVEALHGERVDQSVSADLGGPGNPDVDRHRAGGGLEEPDPAPLHELSERFAQQRHDARHRDGVELADAPALELEEAAQEDLQLVGGGRLRRRRSTAPDQRAVDHETDGQVAVADVRHEEHSAMIAAPPCGAGGAFGTMRESRAGSIALRGGRVSEPSAKFFVNSGVVTTKTDIYNLLRPLLKQTVSYRYRRARHVISSGTGWVERIVSDL